jgi:hypothetical protein
MLKATPKFSDRIDKCTIKTNKLDEISGIVPSMQYPDVFWVHNDDGEIKTVYAINIDGDLLASVELDIKKSKDWEDIAIAKSPADGKYYLFIGDIGDNDAKHDTRKIYRIEEPYVNASQDHDKITPDPEDIDVIEYQYEDGARDCETLLIDPFSNDLYLVTKREENVAVYTLKYPQSYKKENTATKIATLPMGDKNNMLDQIVGGDISPDGSEILIKSYIEVFYYKKDKNETYAQAFAKQPLTLPYVMEPQGEAICWDREGDGYYTISEMGPFKVVPHLYYYPRISSSTKEILKSSINLHIFQDKNQYLAEYTLPESCYVDIYMLDTDGNIVYNLLNEFVFAGLHRTKINSADLPNGFYNVIIDSEKFRDSTKVLIVK